MIFIDSSAFISYFVENDVNHEKVQKIFNEILEEKLITSSDVIVETLNWLTRKASKKIMHELGEILLNEDIAKIIHTDTDDKLAALEIIKKYSDYNLSFTDALSFALIKRLKIKRIFSLDKGFDLLKGVINVFYI